MSWRDLPFVQVLGRFDKPTGRITAPKEDELRHIESGLYFENRDIYLAQSKLAGMVDGTPQLTRSQALDVLRWAKEQV